LPVIKKVKNEGRAGGVQGPLTGCLAGNRLMKKTAVRVQ